MDDYVYPLFIDLATIAMRTHKDCYLAATFCSFNKVNQTLCFLSLFFPLFLYIVFQHDDSCASEFREVDHIRALTIYSLPIKI